MVRIKYLRESRQWSQLDLAKKLGISQPTLAAYELGTKNPKLETLILLSKLFNVSTDYLLEVTDEKNSREDLELLAKIKILDPEQRKAILMILEGYSEESRD